MSELFNLSSLFTESTSYNVLSDVTSGESYMESTMVSLDKLNKSFIESTKDLYVKISEAEDRVQENNVMCNYFSEIEKLIREFVNKSNEMVSRFIINIDNIVDANLDTISNTDLITNLKPFSYRFFKFEKIFDPSYPNMNPLTVYEKEFDFIGQLLQDLGPAASNQSKLEAIATIYNKLNESGKHNSLTKKCIKDILGEDCDLEKFAHELYEEFKEDEPEDIVVNKSVLYDIKLSLSNYKNLENSGVVCAENLIKQFNEILESIKDIICGNKNNTLKIDTPTDGIKNTTYKLDTYSMNQLDLFMKSKINQIIEMINIYSIALSIKLDAITDYFEQCKDIIHMAELNSGITKDDNISAEPTPGNDNTTPDEENQDDSEESKYDEEDDSEEQPKDFQEEPEEEEEEQPKEENPEDMDVEEEPENDQGTNDLSEDIDNLDRDIKDFNFESFISFNIDNHINMLHEILDMINEEGEDQTTQTIGKTKELVDGAKTPVWKSIINNIASLWNKFKEAITGSYEEKVKFLDSNATFIKKKAIDFSPDSGKLMPKMNPSNLINIKIPDLNFNTMKDDLKDENTFFSKHFGNIKKKDGESISQAVKNYIVDPDQYYKNMNELNPVELYGWCKTLPKTLDELQKETAIIQKGRTNAEQIAKRLNESTGIEETVRQYFTEGDYKSSDPKENEKVTNNTDALKVYFKVCGTVLAAQMTCCQRIFKEYYQYLAFHIKKYGGGEKAENNTKQQGKPAAGGDNNDVAFK